jgi:hypothetical protein
MFPNILTIPGDELSERYFRFNPSYGIYLSVIGGLAPGVSSVKDDFDLLSRISATLLYILYRSKLHGHCSLFSSKEISNTVQEIV